MNKDPGADTMFAWMMAIFRHFWILWLVSAVVGLALTGSLIYLIIKLAQHL